MVKTLQLLDGISLQYASISDSSFALPCEADGRGGNDVLQVIYCRAGRFILCSEHDGGSCLEAGDLAVSTGERKISLMLPSGTLCAAILSYDLSQLESTAGGIFSGGSLTSTLKELYTHASSHHRVLKQCSHTDELFSALYFEESPFFTEHCRLIALELLIYLAMSPKRDEHARSEAYHTEQLEAVHRIHDHLLVHMDRRITIDELSRQYHINPTTLKASFKAVYGNSIASHVKEHRMERAEELLRCSSMSISEVAKAVGYDSQGKFTAAFKAYFGALPKDARKLARSTEDCNTKKSR